MENKCFIFSCFFKEGKDANTIKEELLEAIAPLDRGAEATPEDQQRIDQVAFYIYIYALLSATFQLHICLHFYSSFMEFIHF
jgi:hypothetical protein